MGKCGRRRIRAHRSPVSVLTTSLLVLAGCGPSAEVRLVQPQLSGWQREVRLLSESVHWAPGETASRLLAEFPLPGAVRGQPMYLLYLLVPPGAGDWPVTPGTDRGVRGFMIQTRGNHAGLASVVEGQVRAGNASDGPQASREIRLSLTCDDGSRLEGRLRALRNDRRLRLFENRERPVDVEALVGGQVTRPARGRPAP